MTVREIVQRVRDILGPHRPHCKRCGAYHCTDDGCMVTVTYADAARFAREMPQIEVALREAMRPQLAMAFEERHPLWQSKQES